uniref:GMP reductase n=1 Tax=Nannospalax galili TaxID=1026970 RepID=A0A8C6RSN8_NANGA
MPHTDNYVKPDFRDVLLRPKHSTLKSRSEVDLTRSFSFRNSKQTYNGIPIIATNMDTVGTFEMAKFSLFIAVHNCPGDVVKAFGGGADFVMLGGMLAGHSESGGELIKKDGKK